MSSGSEATNFGMPLDRSALSGNLRFSGLFLLIVRVAEVATHRRIETKERRMIKKLLVLAGCTAMVLSIATAHAGPCNTGGKSAQDAGSGPTPGHTGQTIGSTGSANAEHPPTNTMNRATGDVAVSSQDAQKQMQGQPTAAQEGKGADPSAKTADQGC